MSGLAACLGMAHGLLALATGHAHWQLDKTDRQNLAIATQNVLRWYNVKTSQKVIDHLTLAGMMVEIEAPRIMLSARMKAEARARSGQPPRPAGPTKIFQFNPSAAPPANGSTAPLTEPPFAEGPPEPPLHVGPI